MSKPIKSSKRCRETRANERCEKELNHEGPHQSVDSVWNIPTKDPDLCNNCTNYRYAHIEIVDKDGQLHFLCPNVFKE